jgi:DNA-binding MarR family transcriptional regulator
MRAGFKDRRKYAQFIIAGLYRILFSEHNAALGAKYQVHQFASLSWAPKGKDRWHFACRAHEKCCTVSSLPLGQIHFNHLASSGVVTVGSQSKRHHASRSLDYNIVLRYTLPMSEKSGAPARYRLLANFRYEIRQFLAFSEKAARAAGLEPQQHQAMLAVKGLPPHRMATIGVLSERLQIAHHSAVELVNRLEAKKLIRRSRVNSDRRAVVLHLTAAGDMLLQRVTAPHVAELKMAGRKLLRALTSALNHEDVYLRSGKGSARGNAQRSGPLRKSVKL